MNVPARSAPLALAIASVLAIGLSGCKVGPDHTPPKPEAPEAFTHTGAEGFGGSSVIDPNKAVDADWWKMLGDPVLDDLVKRSVVGNLDLRSAAARIREARAQRGVIAPAALPQVDATAGASRSRESKNTRQGSIASGDASNLFQAGFDASWELDVFGRVSRDVEAADADIASAEENRRDVLVTLVSEVARNYVELRGFQQRLAIARKNIQVQQSTLDLTRNRFNAGLSSDLDVAQAESSLASVQALVPQFDAAVQATIHRIGVLLGRRPTELLAELTPESAIPTAPATIPVGLPSDLLRRRPDIRRAERNIAAATARIGVATADLYPRFSITGSFGFAADKVPSLPDASSRFWSFGPAMRWPILDWGRIRSNIAVQDARSEQSLVLYEQAVLRSFEEVENSLVNYTREQARRTSLVSALNADRRAFDVANRLYASGVADFQRVLDSQRALFAGEDALSESDKQMATNLVSIYKALGGGWETILPVEQAAAPKIVPSSFLKRHEQD
jgi:NodT family efflux transporter outer membrane factor (OMF) lipoprotein